MEYYTLYENNNGTVGIAIVPYGYKAMIHSHKEDETYVFLEGKGKLLLGNDTIVGQGVVKIPGDTKHAMTPYSERVVLLYIFKTSPFSSIIYNYIQSYL